MDPFYDETPTPVWDDETGRPPTWRDGGATVLVDTPWIQVTQHPATAPTGLETTYTVLRQKALATGVLPIHADGTVTLVGQQRFALGNYTWEMPEGGVPDGETPLEGIKRELAEEAGLKAEQWVAVLKLEISNSVTDERGVAFLAWDLSPAPGDPDPTEMLATARVPFLQLLEEIDRGAVRDAMTVATAYRAYHMAVTGRLPEALAKAMLGA